MCMHAWGARALDGERGAHAAEREVRRDQPADARARLEREGERAEGGTVQEVDGKDDVVAAQTEAEAKAAPLRSSWR